jgi:hypothetical protein
MAGLDLLTAPPQRFEPPARDFGEYETRPVYGYDDCFPSVDPCDLPGHPGVRIRDHGELCWLPWDVSREPDGLTCIARSAAIPGLRFQRSLTFADTSLVWRFEVCNEGRTSVPFLHVMHALMPLEAVTGLHLPAFAAVIDEISGHAPPFASPDDCAAYLRALPRGQATMLLLRGVREGRFDVVYSHGLRLSVTYPAEFFPTLGIWWNNGGYPDEDACRRTECALEAMPGTWSSLARSYADAAYQSVPPAQRRRWEVVWRVSP